MKRPEIISVGHGYVKETDGSYTTDILMERIAREAYSQGYLAGHRKRHDVWQGIAAAVLIGSTWLLIWLLARAL